MQPNNVSFLSGMNRFRTGSYKTILIPKKWTPECYVKVVTLIIGTDWDYTEWHSGSSVVRLGLILKVRKLAILKDRWLTMCEGITTTLVMGQDGSCYMG